MWLHSNIRPPKGVDMGNITYRVKGVAVEDGVESKYDDTYDNESEAMDQLYQLKDKHPFGIFVVQEVKTIAGYWG